MVWLLGEMGKFITPYWKTTGRVSSLHPRGIFKSRLALVLLPPLPTTEGLITIPPMRIFWHYRGEAFGMSNWHFGLQVYSTLLSEWKLSIIRVKSDWSCGTLIEKPDQLVVYPVLNSIEYNDYPKREQTVLPFIQAWAKFHRAAYAQKLAKHRNMLTKKRVC